jgi:hypothetical protein
MTLSLNQIRSSDWKIMKKIAVSLGVLALLSTPALAYAGTTPSNISVTLTHPMLDVNTLSTQTKTFTASSGSISTLNLFNGAKYQVSVVRSWGGLLCDWSPAYLTGSTVSILMSCPGGSTVSAGEQVTLHMRLDGSTMPPQTITASWVSN